MKPKSLLVLLLAGVWGVGSWWWYTCKIKGFCGADNAHIAAQTAAGAGAAAGSQLAQADLDSDGDGIPDAKETSLGLNPNSDDSDNDGVPDALEIKRDPQDTDKDGKIDALDDDDDGDGVLTRTEIPDQNHDGNVDDASDSNGNQIADYLESGVDGSHATTADADKAKADADAAAKTQADADKAKADADAAAKTQADADKAKADADAAAKTQADADKAKADADAAAKTQADADKAKTEADAAAKAQADNETKVTMEQAQPVAGTDIGPATLHFPTGSANPQLADETKAYFQKVVDFLKANPTAKVTIVGHTDNVGKPERNKQLGQQRADTLKKILVKMGASTDAVASTSEGDAQPIADNTSDAGRKKNRRVELTPVK